MGVENINELDSCDKEPIHKLGAIQSYAYLISGNLADGQTSYYSQNFLSLIEDKVVSPDFLENFNNLKVGNGQAAAQNLQTFWKDGEHRFSSPTVVQIGKVPHNMISHKFDGQCIVEFEPVNIDGDRQMAEKVAEGITEILRSETFNERIGFAANYIKQIIEYDRVMVYRFEEDGHGIVIAESKNENISSYLDLNFPAGDIPKQARELYKINLVRQIADVSSTNIPILSFGIREATLDLTYSHTRAVSPIHLQYLKNMDVQGSFSISIIVQNELWGLIACHNKLPKYLDFEQRNAAKIVSKILSFSIEQEMEMEENRKKIQVDQFLVRIMAQMPFTKNFLENISNHLPAVAKLMDAQGVQVFIDKVTASYGTVLPEEKLQALVQHAIEKCAGEDCYATDSIDEVFPDIAKHNGVSGAYVKFLDPHLQDFIVWYRPQLSRSIKWAGDPTKIYSVFEEGKLTISPRKSFEAWSQLIKNKSAVWSYLDRKTATEFKDFYLNYQLQTNETVRSMREQIREIYNEFDIYSHSISHDLKNPLTIIRNFAQLIARTTPIETNKLAAEKIIASTDKINFIIDEVVKYSKANGNADAFIRIDAKSIIESVLDDLLKIFDGKKVEIEVRHTTDVYGSMVMVVQVFQNVISNAVKYSYSKETPKVLIDTEEHNEFVVYKIKDNGVGVSGQIESEIYTPFVRASNVDDVVGTGLGLAIVKRLMKKLKGDVWFETKLGEGTTFYLKFLKPVSQGG